MHNHEMTPTAYRVLTMVGHCFNGIGSVWLARHAASGNLVAVKKYDVDKCSFEVLSILQHESQAMRQLRHARLMPCLSSFVSGTELWMVEPLCGYGSTKDLLAAHFTEGLPERAIALILRDVVRALDYLHSQGYVHRSVRASHILIGANGDTYLAGLRSSYCSYRDGRRLARIHQFPELAADGLNWLSPEILAQDLRGYTASSDVYSLGITACELANGLEPFAQMPPAAMLHEKLAGEGEPVLLDATTIDAGYAERVQEQNDTDDPAVHEDDTSLRLMRAAPGRRFSDAFHQFVRLCVDREPSRRPTPAQLLTHPFLVRQCRRAPPLSHLLRPDVPVSEATLLEGEQIVRDRLVTDMAGLQLNQENTWDF
ncbi:STE20-related kinase adapter protein alpha [Amphibalanus amphitrite]|uniref:STE20-related kinase adapter protein alpha n=2 Tax=Amphibalanus amphitrite TaxID=1232801 RepID=A0A6A4VXX1_AMPAM|nr:STE20-related kinase adapter protein alpha-like [Amphibalanus amphitrite]XP_043211466.1 STE20-related kinase adapter protein alpha-like [Amphibalanus amphitrite]XP_043211467.1 STE20-related kinase adapter protein alpha-like [Amphibalanus amphitrite]XP_043211468.1 STE20-related kinase adapter protein alpha-like [Amphibalanus amphitrite]XP_043217664.1 STE20-related kinase adapter protein alpha-like isoform X2 [Amphibalanus amphitrite]XP_043217665.1 STE20-related kinase adapter protein alpha-l